MRVVAQRSSSRPRLETTLAATVLASLLALPVLAAPPPADSSAAAATGPGPASGLTGEDVPNDAGRALSLHWNLSADDSVGAGKVTQYYVERAPDPSGPWTLIDSVAARTRAFDDQSVQRNTDYFYRIVTLGPGGSTLPRSVTGPLRASSSWFNDGRYSVL